MERCSHCGKWFEPNKNQLVSLKINRNIYCSQQCGFRYFGKIYTLRHKDKVRERNRKYYANNYIKCSFRNYHIIPIRELKDKIKYCQICGKKATLTAHHLIYRKEFNPKHILLLCHDCHCKQHEGYWHGVDKFKVIEDDY